MSGRAFAALCGALIGTPCASEAAAQAARATLIGFVRDTSGVAVPFARLTASGLLTLSDTAGRFTLGGLPSGSVIVAIRRLGFAPLDLSFDLLGGRIDSVSIVLRVLPQDLPGVTADADARLRFALAEFYRHRATAEGTFFDRREIDAMRATRISDVMRRVPGMRLVPDRMGRMRMRVARTTSGRDCPPEFWVDGIHAPFLNVDDLPLQDVEALEIYKGPATLPPEYNTRLGNPACGTIVIWTRVPG